MASTPWDMSTRRIGCGRWSSSGGSASAGSRRSSARRPCLRTVSCGRSATAAPHERRGWPRRRRRRAEIDAYVAGINAFLASHRGSTLPPEFTLLRFAPEPFDGADVVVWQKMMAWDLSGNYALELLRRDLAAKVGAAGMAELMPSYPHDGLSIVPSLKPPIVARAIRSTVSGRPDD